VVLLRVGHGTPLPLFFSNSLIADLSREMEAGLTNHIWSLKELLFQQHSI
jgi:hypothetical protein